MPSRTLIIQGDVSAITGDLNHKGDIIVFGSIRPGYTVRSDGNLLIHGNVTRARALAGGDIVVDGIAQGDGALLDAMGSIVVGHARDAHILAGMNIEIRRAAERCELVASCRILALGTPGRICGGSARAGLCVEARHLDASGGGTVTIEVDQSSFVEDRKEIEQRLAFAGDRLEKTLGTYPRTAEMYRRRVADASTYRQLASGLSWKLRQAESAGVHNMANYVKVTGGGPTRANIFLGPHRRKLTWKQLFEFGSFMAVASGDSVSTQRIEEEQRVG